MLSPVSWLACEVRVLPLAFCPTLDFRMIRSFDECEFDFAVDVPEV